MEALEQQIPETPEGTQLYNQAIELLYGQKYETISKSLQGKKDVQVSTGLANIVMSAIQRLSKDTGQKLGPKLATEVGFRLLKALMEDMVADGIIEPLNQKQFTVAVADMIDRYGKFAKIPPSVMQKFLTELQGGGELKIPKVGGKTPEMRSKNQQVPAEAGAQPPTPQATSQEQVDPTQQQGLLGA